MSDNFSWLDELNPQQRAAVTHGEGPLLVVAGAGSGKTKTLAYRVAYLIATGVDPSRILLLTFTRRSAEEMIRRAHAVIAKGGAADGTPAPGRIWGGTFHATANRLLRIYGPGAGISEDFTVMDESDAQDLLSVTRHALGLAARDRRFPRKSTCLNIYSRRVSGNDDLGAVLKKHFPWCAEWEDELKSLFKEYVARKQKLNVFDYDDLLLYWAQLLEDDDVARSMGERFDHILVDEYQDTNPVQARILHGMRKHDPRVMAVGDDAQSIYSFRSATVRNMLDFPDIFPGTEVVTLEQNYRSTAPILETTNRVIAQAKDRYTKELWTERGGGIKPGLVSCRDEAEQDEFIASTILKHYEEGIPLKKIAVLFRAAHHSDSLEIELARRNIPYHKFGGLRFLESAHIKDLISFLRIVENPRDEMAWFRILQMIEGVGPSTAAAAVRHLHEHLDDPQSIAAFRAPPAAAEQMKELGTLVSDLKGFAGRTPAAQVERIRAFYEPLFQKRYDNPAVRIKDIEHLEQIASGYRSSRSFLTDLTLDPPSSTSDLAGPPVKDDDWMTLSTIHSAKGCEWNVVFVIHVSDGNIPSDLSTGSRQEIEEELRLLYVAMTRARDVLYVSWPLRYYYKWKQRFTDRHAYAQVSRFISDGVRETMERVEFKSRDRKDQDDPVKPSIDVKKNIRSMWD